jgi:hypothetical protein
MRRLVISLAVLVLAVAGCGAEDRPSGQAGVTTEPGTAIESTLVGEWQRVTTCEERVAALEAAGLDQFAAEHAAGQGWVPGVSSPDQLEDPENPCKGAVPLDHGHFFTADGEFGSRDDAGDPVDDGAYRLIDDRTIVITKEFGDVTFHFDVRDDNSLLLEPVMPACTDDGCFAAQWAVAVAYPGLAWTRLS